MEDAYFFLVRQPYTGEVMLLFKSNRSMVVPKILEIQFKLGFLYFAIVQRAEVYIIWLTFE